MGDIVYHVGSIFFLCCFICSIGQHEWYVLKENKAERGSYLNMRPCPCPRRPLWLQLASFIGGVIFIVDAIRLILGI